MARALRIDIAGGWYHILNRGIERRAIFSSPEDYRHFLELLGELPERYQVKIHGYVLIANHYHLLIETHEANCSAAMQWLNVSYSVWYNRRSGRVGPLFQGRFKSVVVENGGWALGVLDYIHLNPVRVTGLGLDKRSREAERAGRLAEPRPEEVAARLKVLRGYGWSSYGAYSGYGGQAKWLTTRELLRRMERGDIRRGQQRYRARVEGLVRQGAEEGSYAAWRGRVAIGAERFIARIGGLLKGDYREQPLQKQLMGRKRFEDVVGVVEREKGEVWERFKNRHGDFGRDLVLMLARRHSGMKLKELGMRVGGLDYGAVSEAVRRLERQIKVDRKLSALSARLTDELLKIET